MSPAATLRSNNNGDNVNSSCSSNSRRGHRRPRPCASGALRPAVTDGLPMLCRLDVPRAIQTAQQLHAAHAKTLLHVPAGEAVIIAIMQQFPGEQVTERDMMAAYKLVVSTMFPNLQPANVKDAPSQG